MMLFILIVVPTVVYTSVAGYIGMRQFNTLQNRCGRGSHGACMHEVPACLAGLFWPFTIPLLIGAALGDTNHRESVSERRKNKELQEERHKTELARERAMQADFLNQELKAHGKEHLVVKD